MRPLVLGREEEVALADELLGFDGRGHQGLTPGEEYTVTGTLMDKEMGKPVQSGGRDVTATAAFTLEKPSGSVSLSFTFDGSALKDHEIVAFEPLSKDGTEVAAHADLEDAGQTVKLVEEPLALTTPTLKPGLPKTDDSVPLIPLTCLAAAAACGIGILLLMRRRGNWIEEDEATRSHW